MGQRTYIVIVLLIMGLHTFLIVMSKICVYGQMRGNKHKAGIIHLDKV